MFDINAASYGFLYVILSDFYINAQSLPLFSWSLLFSSCFLNPYLFSLHLYFFISISISPSVSGHLCLCWGLCEPQMPLQHLLLPLRPLQPQLKVGLPLRLPQPPTLELVGDWKSVCASVCVNMFESVVESKVHVYSKCTKYLKLNSLLTAMQEQCSFFISIA